MNPLPFGFGIIQIGRETKKLLPKHCQVVYVGPTFWIRSHLFVFVLESKSSRSHPLLLKNIKYMVCNLIPDESKLSFSTLKHNFFFDYITRCPHSELLLPPWLSFNLNLQQNMVAWNNLTTWIPSFNIACLWSSHHLLSIAPVISRPAWQASWLNDNALLSLILVKRSQSWRNTRNK